jgi:hypothetical protein
MPLQRRQEREYLKNLNNFLDQSEFYFSLDYDITRRVQHIVSMTAAERAQPLWQRVDDRFFWNKHISRSFIEAKVTLPDFRLNSRSRDVLLFLSIYLSTGCSWTSGYCRSWMASSMSRCAKSAGSFLTTSSCLGGRASAQVFTPARSPAFHLRTQTEVPLG